MSKLYIREYVNQSLETNGQYAPAGSEPGTDQAAITISGTSAQSAAFAAGTNLIRVHTDVICSILFGANPTATTGAARMNANTTEYFGVPVQGGFKLAVIANT